MITSVNAIFFVIYHTFFLKYIIFRRDVKLFVNSVSFCSLTLKKFVQWRKIKPTRKLRKTEEKESTATTILATRQPRKERRHKNVKVLCFATSLGFVLNVFIHLPFGGITIIQKQLEVFRKKGFLKHFVNSQQNTRVSF